MTNMDIGNLAAKMQDMAKHCISVDHTENEALAEVAALLAAISAPARLLTYEEIEQLPEFAVVWEEWRGWAPEYRENALEIAPVARMGNGLAGNGITTIILPEMMDGDEEGQSRWWTALPTQEQREETPWQTNSTAEQSPTA